MSASTRDQPFYCDVPQNFYVLDDETIHCYLEAEAGGLAEADFRNGARVVFKRLFGSKPPHVRFIGRSGSFYRLVIAVSRWNFWSVWHRLTVQRLSLPCGRALTPGCSLRLRKRAFRMVNFPDPSTTDAAVDVLRRAVPELRVWDILQDLADPFDTAPKAGAFLVILEGPVHSLDRLRKLGIHFWDQSRKPIKFHPQPLPYHSSFRPAADDHEYWRPIGQLSAPQPASSLAQSDLLVSQQPRLSMACATASAGEAVGPDGHPPPAANPPRAKLRSVVVADSPTVTAPLAAPQPQPFSPTVATAPAASDVGTTPAAVPIPAPASTSGQQPAYGVFQPHAATAAPPAPASEPPAPKSARAQLFPASVGPASLPPPPDPASPATCMGLLTSPPSLPHRIRRDGRWALPAVPAVLLPAPAGLPPEHTGLPPEHAGSLPSPDACKRLASTYVPDKPVAANVQEEIDMFKACSEKILRAFEFEDAVSEMYAFLVDDEMWFENLDVDDQMYVVADVRCTPVTQIQGRLYYYVLRSIPQVAALLADRVV